MPGIDGIEVLRRVKRTHPHIEVIILTGHGSEEDRTTCMELGAFAYLQKPVDIDALSETLKQANEKARGSARAADISDGREVVSKPNDDVPHRALELAASVLGPAQTGASRREKHSLNLRRLWKTTVLIMTVVSLAPLVVMTVVDYRVTQGSVESEFLLRTSRIVSNTKRVVKFSLVERTAALDFIVQDNTFQMLTDCARLEAVLDSSSAELWRVRRPRRDRLHRSTAVLRGALRSFRG